MKTFILWLAVAGFFGVWGKWYLHARSRKWSATAGIGGGFVIALVAVLVVVTPIIYIYEYTQNRGQAPVQSSSTANLEVIQKPAPKGIGISYQQAMHNLSGIFTMKPAPLPDKTTRMVGKSWQGLEMLEVLGGNKANIESVALAIAIPKNDEEAVDRSVLLIMTLCKNAFPEWEQSSNWAISTLGKLVKLNSKDQVSEMIFRGDKVLNVSVVRSLSIFTVTISHKDSL